MGQSVAISHFHPLSRIGGKGALSPTLLLIKENYYWRIGDIPFSTEYPDCWKKSNKTSCESFKPEKMSKWKASPDWCINDCWKRIVGKLSSWWFQAIWKKYSSNWIISPGRGEHKKIFETTKPPPSYCFNPNLKLETSPWGMGIKAPHVEVPSPRLDVEVVPLLERRPVLSTRTSPTKWNKPYINKLSMAIILRHVMLHVDLSKHHVTSIPIPSMGLV